jgi:hypothetical protein
LFNPGIMLCKAELNAYLNDNDIDFTNPWKADIPVVNFFRFDLINRKKMTGSMKYQWYWHHSM